ncbi:MAG: cyclohexa-1,5-dienecarbonyl-CoA hydratase [Bacteroidetes bacterium]|nr:MAG: cyclohexa-1,5-dienecarbonyl-CoA hydratase [Bacteroidota bacterium]
MEKISLEFTHNESVARIILNDGKGNVLDSVMMKDLHNVFAELKNNNNIKLITFEGAGKHFSFGASVPEHTKSEAGKMLDSFHKLFYELIDMSIPTMAKISGQCLGGGMELALICNFLFADKTAKLGQPEIILGVFPPPASLLLPLKIGWARAEELLITGKTITAEEAKALGLLNDVFDDRETMESKLNEWIEKNIVPKSSSSLQYSVRAARVRFNKVVKKSLPKLEQMYLTGLMETDDANEGINAFCEKRSPEWKNR